MNPTSRHLYSLVLRESIQIVRSRPSKNAGPVRRVEKSAQPVFENNLNISREVIPYKPKSTDLYILKKDVDLVPFEPKTKALTVINKIPITQQELLKKMILHNLFVVTEDRYLFNLLSPGLNSINKALMCIKNPKNNNLKDDFLAKYQSRILELVSLLVAGFIVDALLQGDSADSKQIMEDQENLIHQVVQDVAVAIEDLEKIVVQTNSQSDDLIKQVEGSSLPETEKSRMKNQIKDMNLEMTDYLESQKAVLVELKEKCQQLKPEAIKEFVSNQTRDIGTTILCVLCGFNLPVSVLTSVAISALSDTSLNKTEAIAKYQTFLNQLEPTVRIPNRQIIDGIIDAAMWGMTDKIEQQASKIHSSVAVSVGIKVLSGLISNHIKNEANPTLSKSELQALLQSGEIKKLKDELIQAHREKIHTIQGFVSDTQKEYTDYLQVKQDEMKRYMESRWSLTDTVNSIFGRLKGLW